MYSGVAEPASPASTEAASPGARRRSRKFKTRIAKTTGTAYSARRSAKVSLLVGVGAVERRVEPERAHDQVLELLVVDGDELQLVDPHERRALHDDLLEFLVERRPLLGIDLDGRLIHQLVGFGR